MPFFIAFLSGVILFYSFQFFPFSTAIISFLSSLYLSIKKTNIIIFAIFLGVAIAFVRYEPVKDIPYIKDKIAVEGVFESYPIKTDSGVFRQTLKVESAKNIKTGKELKEIDGENIILFSDREFDPGIECEIAVKFLKDRKRFNPGAQNKEELYANLLEVRGLRGETPFPPCISKIQEYRYRLNRYFEENFKKDSGAFIASITTGQRANIDEELRNAFNVTGLAHILSISGTHFGLFSVFLFSIFRFLIKAFPYRILQRITIFLTPSQAAAILCFPFILAYLGLSGASIPTIRSFIMISLFLLGLIIGRKGLWLNSLLLAAFVIVVWEPKVIFNLSFQLSFLAVMFIGSSIGNRENKEKSGEELKETRFPMRMKNFFIYVENALLLTVSASIGTAPLVAYYFHYFSVISPISNLFIAPLVGFMLIPLSVISSFLFLITGHFIFTPVVSAFSDLSIFLVRLLAHVPFADIKIPAFPVIVVLLFYGGFIFYFLFNKRRYALIIPFVPILIYLFISIFERNDLKITYLDVGQGDSSVIELPDQKTVVMDTGRSGWETASFLKYRGKKTVDAIILSHAHPDHTGGLDYIVNRFKVRELWDNGRLILPDTVNNIKHRSLNRGDMIEGKGFSMYVFHPYPEFYTMDGSEYIATNNDSIVLKIEGKYKSFLFTGDVEEEAEENILHLGRWLKSDVIKVPHHGGKTSAYEPFLKAVSPDIAVISAGHDNTFGHPHQETLNALHGAKIFRTDIDGAIKIKETAKGFEIKTFKDFHFERAESLTDEIKNFKRLFETW